MTVSWKIISLNLLIKCGLCDRVDRVLRPLLTQNNASFLDWVCRDDEYVFGPTYMMPIVMSL